MMMMIDDNNHNTLKKKKENEKLQDTLRCTGFEGTGSLDSIDLLVNQKKKKLDSPFNIW